MALNDKYLLTQEEQLRINLVDFIQELFSSYQDLYIINIFLYKSSIVQKGKVIEVKPTIKLGVAFKYPSCYCFWFNGGAKTCSNKEELFNSLENVHFLPLLANENINFYIKTAGNKVTYKEFESNILKTKELNPEVIQPILDENKSIHFCRDSIFDDARSFLGKNLVCKQNAKRLDGMLLSKIEKPNCSKV